MAQTIPCKNCQTRFEITNDDIAFYEKISPKLNEKIHVIPAPTICPACRLQKKLAFRNERALYRRSCSKCKKLMVSIYSPDKERNIYCGVCWWSDGWSALDYGRDFDFTKTFAENFEQLWRDVPIIGLWNIKDENAEYNNGCFELKNSYMNFNSDWGENYLYSYVTEMSKDMTDCAYSQKSELCYECIDVINAYNCIYSQDLENSQDCYFSSDLIGCRKCFGCHGLRHKEGYIYNKKVSDQEWNEFIQSIKLTPKKIQEYKEKSLSIRLTVPKKALHMTQCENSSGDYLYHCNNVQNCFDMTNGEESKNVIYNVGSYKLHDTYASGDAQWTYEFMGGGVGIHNVAFSHYCVENVSNTYYSIFCANNSHNLFGCAGIRQGQYCIFNKQYTKERYEELVEKIINHMKKTGEWGEAFPAEISPYGYNETLAHEYFPLSKEEVVKMHFNWSDYKMPSADIQSIQAKDLPENITDTPDDILANAIECEVTKKLFRVVKEELQFYRKLGLPLPRRHPDQRHKDRLALRNPRTLYGRSCAKCSTPIQTTYSPDRPETVYCEKCYLEAVY